jgi:hypothetical protein
VEGAGEAEGEGEEWLVVGGVLGGGTDPSKRKPIELVARKRKSMVTAKWSVVVRQNSKRERINVWWKWTLGGQKTKDGNSGGGLRGGRTATTSKPSSNRLDPVVASPLFRFRLLGVKESSSLGDTLAVLHVVANGLLFASL